MIARKTMLWVAAAALSLAAVLAFVRMPSPPAQPEPRSQLESRLQPKWQPKSQPKVQLQSQPRPQPDRSDAAAVSGFLERNAARQAIRERVLLRRGRQAALRGIEILVAATPVEAPGAQRPVSDALRTGLLRALQTDAGQGLAVLGYTAADITHLRARGIDPVTAMLRVTRGAWTFDDFALLADHIVLARSVGHDDAADLGDGFYSSQFLQVEAVLKGPAKVGDVFAVRQQSGLQPDGTRTDSSADLGSAPGTRLLMLSSQMYEQLSLEQDGKPAAGHNVVDYGPGYSVTTSGNLLHGPRFEQGSKARPRLPEAQARIARTQGVP